MVALEWRDGVVRYIDQTVLPSNEVYRETRDVVEIASAIKRLAIRGAPLIGIAAAYGVVLAANACHEQDPARFHSHVDKAINLLTATRPTAVNLFWALNRQRVVAEANAHQPPEVLRSALLREAIAIHKEDAARCDAIAALGADLLPNAASVLTHCNAGALATGGIGTAVGVIRTAWEQHKLKHVYVDETRPLLQGARLTAWELQKLGIPFTLIPDNTAAFLMQRRLIDAVVVGADRIAMNGDVANKIGTYNLAVLAMYHQIPFIVAAPTSTIDGELEGGEQIPIEQRSPAEVTTIGGVRVAPEGIEVYSPAFDITPSDLITAIVTDQGVLRKPFDASLKQVEKMSARRC